MHTITTPESLQQQIEALIILAPRFATAYSATALPRLRLHQGGFRHLCQIIVSQQLSVAAADSIWQRLNDKKLIAETALRQADDNTLRACGLSKQKIRYLKSLAEHHIDYAALQQQSDASVIKNLNRRYRYRTLDSRNLSAVFFKSQRCLCCK